MADSRSRRRSDSALYVISVMADLAGVHPQTLRMYERKGLLEPKRTAGNSRRYSDRDVAQLKRIQVLTEAGVNLAGVRIIVDLERRLEQVQTKLERANRRAAELEARLADQSAIGHRGMLVRLSDVRNIFESGRRTRS